jgi:hypothetical protein
MTSGLPSSRFPRQPRRGYVLVVALALLVLSATVMVGISLAAIRHASAARQAHADLQRRYGSRSIRAVVLRRADSILANAEAVQKQPVPVLRAQLRLGNFSYQLIVADEQAKANVNRMLERAEPAVIEARLRDVLSGTGIGPAVRLRAAPEPIASGPASGPVPRRVTGIGQLFDLSNVSPQQLLDRTRLGPAPLELVTAWGDGRVNLRRASAASARLVLVPPLSSIDVERLLAGAVARRNPEPDEPLDPLARLLSQVGVPYSVEGRSVGVSLGSSCHSIWVIADDGRRQWCEFEVLDQTDPQQPASSYFSW